MSARARCRLIAAALWPTVLIWLAFLVFALWREADWPDSNDGWYAFLLICLIIEFCTLKALIMARRMVGYVPVTVALISTNVSFAVIFSVQQGLSLWPEFFFVEHPGFTTWSIRVLETILAAALIWGAWELASVPPPAPLDEETEAIP